MIHATTDVIEDGDATSYDPPCLLAGTDSSFCAYLVLQLYVAASLFYYGYIFAAAVFNRRLLRLRLRPVAVSTDDMHILFPYETYCSCTVYPDCRNQERINTKPILDE